MILKLHEIVNLYYEINGISKTENDQTVVLLNGLLSQKMNLKNKLYVQRLSNELKKELDLFEEQKKSVETADDLQQLLSAEKEIDVRSIWGNDLSIETFADIETNEVYPVFLKLIDK